jgi:hypothetical protein
MMRAPEALAAHALSKVRGPSGLVPQTGVQVLGQAAVALSVDASDVAAIPAA